MTIKPAWQLTNPTIRQIRMTGWRPGQEHLAPVYRCFWLPSLFARAFPSAGARAKSLFGAISRITMPSEGTTLYADGVKPRSWNGCGKYRSIPRTSAWDMSPPVKPSRPNVKRDERWKRFFERSWGGFLVLRVFWSLFRPSSPSVTSFVCRMHGRLAGPNWLIAGEAPAMVDPMTSNGVTAALRHASGSVATDYRVSPPAQDPLPGSGHV